MGLVKIFFRAKELEEYKTPSGHLTCVCPICNSSMPLTEVNYALATGKQAVLDHPTLLFKEGIRCIVTRLNQDVQFNAVLFKRTPHFEDSQFDPGNFCKDETYYNAVGATTNNDIHTAVPLLASVDPFGQ